MYRKTLAIACSALLAFAAAGCGESSKPNNSSSKTQSTVKTSDFTEKVQNLGGKTIKLASFWNEWGGGDSASAAQQDAAKQLAKIEADYNCKIELISMSTSTYQQDINTAVSSGLVYANLIALQNEHSTIFNSGNIADVKSIKSLNLTSNGWEKTASAVTSRGDKQFGVGFNMSQQDSINRTVLTFNKALAEQYQIEDLYAAVKKGEWTYDKFAKVSQDIVTKSNGAVQGLIDGYHCFRTLINTNNIELVKLENGKYRFNGTSEAVLQGLQFLQDYNKNGLLNTKDYVGNDYGLSEANVFMSGKTLFHMSDYWVVSQVFSSGMPDDYGVLPLPKGPNAAKNVGIVSNTRFFSFIKGDPDIEAAAAVLVAIANRTGVSKERWIEDQAATSLRDDESIEMLEIMLENEIAITGQMMMPTEYSVVTQDVIYKMSKTPKQAMEEIAQVAQGKIDTYYQP